MTFIVVGWALATPVRGQAEPQSLGYARAAAPVTPAAASERIRDYAVDLRLDRAAVLHVRETISYDFGAERRHGIERRIPVEFRYRQDQFREFPLDQIKVSSPSGAPDNEQTVRGPTTTIRIGDPGNGNVTGRQTYVISYDVRGVVNSFSDHQELYWNAVGTQWDVPIDAARATVAGPAVIQKVACFEGKQGSTAGCRGTIGADGAAGFSSGVLGARLGMAVVVSFPVGTFPDAVPILKQRWTWGRAFSLTPATVGASLALFALLGGAAIVPVLRNTRDERYLGVTPGLQPGFARPHTIGRVPWFHRDPVAVQFAPPEGLRPGQLGALLDQRAQTLHVTATIIDLAVRGYLKIEEVVRVRKGKDPSLGDWRLVKQKGTSGQQLRGYESTLHGLIFRTGREVRLSRLRRTFQPDLRLVKASLDDDITGQGWFREFPSKLRARWVRYGLAAVVAGSGLTWALAAWSGYGLLGVSVILAGIAVLGLSRRPPARSAKGTAVLAQTRGFRLYLEKAEASQIQFEEGEDIFSRYLPYAIIFGVAERWAAVFAKLAADGADLVVPNWYVGSVWAVGAFDYLTFSQSVDNFASTTASAVSASTASATPGSSGASGFSGGGGYSGGGEGGGGGGSW